MPRESRIADESIRRLVLAAIMLTLLAGSTALAWWMADGPVSLLEPTQELGGLQFAVPLNWVPNQSPRGTNPANRRVIRFIAEPTAEQQAMLTAILLQANTWRTPMRAMDEARTRIMPIMPASGEQTLSYGPVSVLIFAMQSRRQPAGGEAITQKDALAVATVDGQSYLAFYLTGLGAFRPDDIPMLQRVALSLVDDHYESTDDESELMLEGVQVRLPDGLLALRSVQEEDEPNAGSLLIAPYSSRAFYRMHVSVVTTGQLRQQWEQRGVTEAKTAPVNKLIDEQLKARYYTINGVQPPTQALRAVDRGTRKVRVIVLDDARLRGAQREWWAAQLDDQHVLLLELLADVRALTVANQAAALVMRDVQTQSADQAPAAPPSEAPSP